MSQPDLIVIPFGENATPGTIEEIPDALSPSDPAQRASWSAGFPQITMTPLGAGGKPPRGQDFNGVLNAITQHSVFLGGGGQYKWSSEYVTSNGGYSIGDVIQSDDGLSSYVSTVDNNTINFNSAPASIGVQWKKYGGVDLSNAVLRPDLESASGSSMVGFIQAGSGAVARTAQSKLRESVTINDFYGPGVSLIDACSRMTSAYGFVRFSSGEYVFSSSYTIDYPVHFEPGAFITVPSGAVLTITGPIESPRQYIFRGDGEYYLDHDLDSGEDSRMVHVSWFGAFPGDPAYDNSPRLQKLSNAMVRQRESLVVFEVGTYYVYSGVSWSRASRVMGAGDRLTNIWSKFTSGDVFYTAGVGCYFNNLQFNCDTFRTSGAYISLLHDRCKTFDVYMDHGYVGIDMRGVECESHRTKGLTWSSSAGSRMIRVAADDCLVDTYNYTTSTENGPEYVVSCEVVSSGVPASRPRVLNGLVKTLSTGSCVGILHNSIGAVSGAYVDGLSVASAAYGVSIINNGGFSPNVAEISFIRSYVGSGLIDLVSISNSSSGSIFSVKIDNVICQSASGAGVRIARLGSGSIRNISIGSHDISANIGINVYGSSQSVTPENISISSGICHNCQANGYDVTALNICAAGIMSRSNTGIGVRVGLGSNTVYVKGVSSGNGTNVSDLSGAVTKDVTLIG